MATSFLQKTRQRKIIYFGVIAALFTLSLIHREFVLKPQAFALQLRETALGDVELTSSAVRLLLTGSRGLAVTMLWYTAMEKQKQNEWNELELIVESITKLQPHFITPWLYQSWNISFNVAVECDRPHDKYYYINRGLQLLAKGERFNRGTAEEGAARDPKKVVFPGNPEMRYYMGFIYQLKIGNSDERLTMRSLLEMSCIDPLQRNPKLFWTTDDRGRKIVELEKLARFTQKYPRLVRRLREQLGYSEEYIVKFLQDHQDIPGRFEPTEASARESKVKKDPLNQFPVLPPRDETHWPDPSSSFLTSESIDVFLISRTWYEFAQKPLPPPNPRPTSIDLDYDKTRYRVHRSMVLQLFRQYPARAQIYIAETLDAEGWFDSEGWKVSGWFDALAEQPGGEFASDEGFIVGTETKYHSQAAWEKGHRMYKDFGIENGLYIEPAAEKALQEQAQLARRELRLNPSEIPAIRSEWRQGELGKSLDAHLILRYNKYYRDLTNFDAFYYQSEAEKDPVTVSARKILFQAERKRSADPPSEEMIALYDQAWNLFVQALLTYPKFAQVTIMQEDLYEIYQRYLGVAQEVDSAKKLFRDTAVWFAYHSASPITTWHESLAQFRLVSEITEKPAQLRKVTPIKHRRGALDRIVYYEGPMAQELQNHLFQWSHGALFAMQPALTTTISYPGEAHLLLTMNLPRDASVPPYWRRLISDVTHRTVDLRLGLNQ